jgi:hypothetical protein
MHATCQLDPIKTSMCACAITTDTSFNNPACAEEEFQTLSVKHVCKRVAAQLDCDHKLIKPDVRHVIDQFLEVFSDSQGGDAEAEAAGEHAHTHTHSLAAQGFGAQWVTH